MTLNLKRQPPWLLDGTYYRSLPTNDERAGGEEPFRNCVVSLHVAKSDDEESGEDGLTQVGTAFAVSVPDGESPAIHGNVGEVEQIFLNLLINARQAMPDGGRIEIATHVEEDAVLVRVADSGEGIDREDLERIFDPFFTTREEEGGTGLGLSIIYGIVEKHNGRIEVESEKGLGTTFELQLPIHPS